MKKDGNKLGGRKRNNRPEWTKWKEVDYADFAPERHLEYVEKYDTKPKIYVNSRYQVAIFPVEVKGWPEMVHLSIKTHEKDTSHDWRDYQRIKNELVGPNCEGVELYPSEKRLVDGANQYHLFVFKEDGTLFPFGFLERKITEGSVDGMVQRPFEKGARPEDVTQLKPGEVNDKIDEALEREK